MNLQKSALKNIDKHKSYELLLLVQNKKSPCSFARVLCIFYGNLVGLKWPLVLKISEQKFAKGLD